MNTRSRKQAASEAGTLPHPVFDTEPDLQRESIPVLSRKNTDFGATTGTFPAVTEGRDYTASRDDDQGNIGHGG